MNKEEFLQIADITEDQFYGRENIKNSLFLSRLASIPDGFSPVVMGSLFLDGLASVPDGFSPVVSGDLSLDGLTSIPDGFNPAVGINLFLRSLASVPDGFSLVVGNSLLLNSLTVVPDEFSPVVMGSLFLNRLASISNGFSPRVGGRLYLNGLTSAPDGFDASNFQHQYIPMISWNDGKYIKCDNWFSEVISKKKTTWKLKELGKTDVYYLVTDGDGKYAHGDTVKKAKEDLIFKISSRMLTNSMVRASK